MTKQDALYQLIRLNDLWNKCNRSVIEGKPNETKFLLDTIYRELSPYPTKKEEGNILRFNVLIAKSKTKEELYNLLQKKEILLRKLQNSRGKK